MHKSANYWYIGPSGVFMDEIKGVRNILLILLIIVVFAVLRELSGLIIPLVLAALLTILNLPIVNFLEKRRVPRVFILPLVSILTLGFVFLIITMISGTVDNLMNEQEYLARRFSKKIDSSIVWLGNQISTLNVDTVRTEFAKVVSPANVTRILGSLLGTLGSFGSSFILFLIYYLILLSGATGYHGYVNYVTEADTSGSAREIWEKTQQSISAYMGIKTLMSLSTGIIAGLVCWAFGLQFALFWGFTAFLLNYIPSIGSIVATLLPVFMAIVQFDRAGLIIGLAVVLTLTQFIIGNVLDPMFMGSRLRLNTVTVIFGLLFWGYIWGIPGMLLSVPLLVVIRLLLERSADLKVIARVMGYPPKQRRRGPSLLTRIISKEGDEPSTSGK